jgi:hypothetical protein
LPRQERASSYPAAGDYGFTEFAPILIQVEGRDEIPGPFNEQFAAVVAIGIVPFGIGSVSYIDIMDAFRHGQLTESNQG